jgi:hypothetical protein
LPARTGKSGVSRAIPNTVTLSISCTSTSLRLLAALPDHADQQYGVVDIGNSVTVQVGVPQWLFRGAH